MNNRPATMPPPNKESLTIAVAGANGRMGREILRLATAPDNAAPMRIGAVIGRADSPLSGRPLHVDGREIGVLSPPEALETAAADVLIDFSVPAATLAMADICRRRGIGMVIGVTGFDDDGVAALKAAAADIPVLWAANTSVGIHAMGEIVKTAARQLRAGRLGGGYDMEIYEAHHKHKKDAPSGTALRLGQALAEATGADFSADKVLSRPPWSEGGRGANEIGFAVTRGGDIAGEHRVIFAGSGEQLEIVHRSTTRANYANGALRAARFVAGAAAGFYEGMGAVLSADA